MKFLNINAWLLSAAFALTISSCDEKEDLNSVISSFETFPVISNTTAVVASETDEGEYTFNFAFDDRQITDLTLEVGVGASSTATEDEDFELSTHEIDLAALSGQDNFSVTIHVLEDFIVEGEDETVYLTFTSTTPSGVQEQEILAVTIQDSGTPPQPAEEVDVTLRWELANDIGVSGCDFGFDVDLTFQTQGGAANYEDDLMEYAAATGACPEEGVLHVSDMTDGEVYDIWVYFYGGVDLGTNSDVTVYIDFAREISDFNGTFAVEGVFDSNMEASAAIVGTIERNGNTLILKDADGNIAAEGRVRSQPKQLYTALKRK